MLRFPVLAVNESDTKHLFDNRYGTGQSTLDAIIRATNLLLAGRNFVVARLWLVRQGRRLARARHGRQRHRHRGQSRARHRGGDGWLPRHADASKLPRSATSSSPSPATINVIDGQHLERMKDGAVIANSGHFNDEINIPALETLATGGTRIVRDFVEEYTYADGRKRLPAGRRAPGQPLGGGGPPRQRDGHELRQPGAGRGVHAAQNAKTLEPKV